MKTKVSKALDAYSMLKKGDRVIVGLSGGADSTALLLVLMELGYRVSALHINHNLRGDEALRDESFCVSLCKRLGVTIEVISVDVKAYAKENSMSVETAARELRYKAFSDYAEKNRIKHIATAHHALDNLETAILNITRGTALKGICGIPFTRGNIVRPLLYCTRQEIEDYLASKGQDYVTDSTNLDDFCARNKIRLNVLPILSDINSAYAENFSKTSQILRDEEDFLALCAHEHLSKAKTPKGISIFDLKRGHSALVRRAVAKYLSDNDIEVTADLVASVMDIFFGGKINVKEDTFIVVEGGYMNIKHSEEKTEALSFEVKACNTYDFFDKKIALEIVDTTDADANVHTLFAKCCFDYDKIKGSLFMRNRRNGDKVELVSRGFESKLKKLFWSDVAPSERDKVMILCDSEGIVFVEGYGAAQRVSVTDSTKNMLVVKVDRKDV